MYAIIETGGKQLWVVPGETVKVEKLEAAANPPLRAILTGIFDAREVYSSGRETFSVAREKLIAHFRPTKAYVSASGERQHPHAAVLRGFKDIGAMVFGTYGPRNRGLWFSCGEVPPREGYADADPL